MGIFDRLATLIRSNLNALLNRAEDPEKMLDQLILDMKSQLAKAKQEQPKKARKPRKTVLYWRGKPVTVRSTKQP